MGSGVYVDLRLPHLHRSSFGELVLVLASRSAFALALSSPPSLRPSQALHPRCAAVHQPNQTLPNPSPKPNPATQPNPTKPNLTQPKQTKPNQTIPNPTQPNPLTHPSLLQEATRGDKFIEGNATEEQGGAAASSLGDAMPPPKPGGRYTVHLYALA